MMKSIKFSWLSDFLAVTFFSCPNEYPAVIDAWIVDGANASRIDRFPLEMAYVRAPKN